MHLVKSSIDTHNMLAPDNALLPTLYPNVGCCGDIAETGFATSFDATSQNGWIANDRSLIWNPTIPGLDITLPGGLRKGDVSTVLLYVAQQFHLTVENITKGWNWGYAERAIRGGTQLSNHASGTAIDLNAPHHPLGKAATFKASAVKAIRRILDFCEGVVRWGGDYTLRKDEMHFEIIGTIIDVARIAKKILGKVVPSPTGRKLVKVIHESFAPGNSSFTVLCPVGGASLVARAARVRAKIDGTGRVEIWPERGNPGNANPAGIGSKQDWTLQRGDCPSYSLPDGTEFLTVHVTGATGRGAILVEFESK